MKRYQNLSASEVDRLIERRLFGFLGEPRYPYSTTYAGMQRVITRVREMFSEETVSLQGYEIFFDTAVDGLASLLENAADRDELPRFFCIAALFMLDEPLTARLRQASMLAGWAPEGKSN